MKGLAKNPPGDGSSKPRSDLANEGKWPRQLWETIRRALVEFLIVPTLVIGGFLLLALAMYVIDASRSPYGADPASRWGGLFSDPQASRGFLGVIATSIITVTSITLSLLLIAVQQGAASLTSLVFDQFLRRRTNQLYFGFFIGLALYSLIVLASINASHQPVYGLAVAGVMTATALFMLIVLIYTTINQMRPVVIIRSIHDHTLLARERQRELLRITRRRPRYPDAVCAGVASDRSGFAARIDVAGITKALPDAETEVVILVSIGDYVAFGDSIAEIRMSRQRDVSAFEPAIRNAVALEEQRNLDTDPTFGIEQLVTIGWTSISTAKSNPDPGLLTIYSLRDLLARWLDADEAFGSDTGANPTARVIYPDNLSGQIIKGFESLAVVASESMQHQSAAEIYRTFASLFDRLPPALQRQAEDLLMRSLSGLGDHILTSDLEASLSAVIGALTAAGRTQSADAIGAAQRQLELSIGRLNSRSTRTAAGREHPSAGG